MEINCDLNPLQKVSSSVPAASHLLLSSHPPSILTSPRVMMVLLLCPCVNILLHNFPVPSLYLPRFNFRDKWVVALEGLTFIIPANESISVLSSPCRLDEWLTIGCIANWLLIYGRGKFIHKCISILLFSPSETVIRHRSTDYKIYFRVMYADIPSRLSSCGGWSILFHCALPRELEQFYGQILPNGHVK